MWPVLEGGAHTYATCTVAGECIALVPGCCGVCGTPTLADVVGVNMAQVDAFKAETCGDAGTVCPQCEGTPDPNLIALCENSECTPIDLRTDTFSACQRDEDCRLRYADCCEPCVATPSAVVALTTLDVGLYTLELCKKGQTCPSCAPVYPDGWTAACGPDGHCRVLPGP